MPGVFPKELSEIPRGSFLLGPVMLEPTASQNVSLWMRVTATNCSGARRPIQSQAGMETIAALVDLTDG
jgi:hypothetical protein